MTPTVHKHETNVAEIIVCYCFLSTPEIVDCFDDYYNLSIQSQNSVIVSDSKLFHCVWLPVLLCLPRCLRLRGHQVSVDWQLPVAQLPHQDWVRAGVSVLPRAVLPPWKWGSVIAFSPSSAALSSNLTHIFVFLSQHCSPKFISLLFWWYRKPVSSFTFLSFPYRYLIFWVTLVTTDPSSQLMKGWMIYHGTLNHWVVEQFFPYCPICQWQCCLGKGHVYYETIYDVSGSCSSNPSLPSLSGFHFLSFSVTLFQGLRGIHVAQLRWTRTRTVATRIREASTSAARTWARLSWGFSTPSLALALVPWGEMPGQRAKLQPRYCQLHIWHIAVVKHKTYL